MSPRAIQAIAKHSRMSHDEIKSIMEGPAPAIPLRGKHLQVMLLACKLGEYLSVGMNLRRAASHDDEFYVKLFSNGDQGCSIAFSNACACVLRNRLVCVLACTFDVSNLRFCPWLHDDGPAMLTIISRGSASCFIHASGRLRSDPFFVFEALKLNPDVAIHLPKITLKHALCAAQSLRSCMHVYLRLCPEDQADPTLIRKMVRTENVQLGMLRWDASPEALRAVLLTADKVPFEILAEAIPAHCIVRFRDAQPMWSVLANKVLQLEKLRPGSSYIQALSQRRYSGWGA